MKLNRELEQNVVGIFFLPSSSTLSNAHQLCCEGSPTKCMTIAGPTTLASIQDHKSVSNLTTFYLAISRIYYFSYCIQTWHDGRLMRGLYAHARFDDIELDLDFTNVYKTCPSWVLFHLFYPWTKYVWRRLVPLRHWIRDLEAVSGSPVTLSPFVLSVSGW